LITGASSGIGRDLALALANLGCNVTLVDIDAPGAHDVVKQIQTQGNGTAQAIAPIDISNARQQASAFVHHSQTYGRLDFALLNAGIGETEDLISGPYNNNIDNHDDNNDNAWKRTLDVNFTAVAQGCRLAVKHMMMTNKQISQPSHSSSSSPPPPPSNGVIMVTASAGGIFPMPLSPIYSASKAAAVQLVKSLAQPLHKRYNIRICALCPQFVQTNLMKDLSPEMTAKLLKTTKGEVMSVEHTTRAGLSLLLDPMAIGTCLLVLTHPTGALAQPVDPPKLAPITLNPPIPVGVHSNRSVDPSKGQNEASSSLLLKEIAQRSLLTTSSSSSFKKWQIRVLSRDFRVAARLVTAPFPNPLPSDCIVLKRLYVGINASDNNYSEGKYHGSKTAAQQALPFDAGFESVGIIVAKGPSGSHNSRKNKNNNLNIGDAVATIEYGGFSEYGFLSPRSCLPIPFPTPEMLALLTSGLTASIAFEVSIKGGLQPGSTVLVTAAAGGTGQFAVQLAKIAGCRVIATCSGGEKATLLKSLGADVVINYKTQDLKQSLKQHGPIHVVYESVGGSTFQACIDVLAVGGTIIIIGMMSQYNTSNGWEPSQYKGLNEKLLWKGAALQGFFLIQHTKLWRRHLEKLVEELKGGRLKVALDSGRERGEGGFVGLESVPDAIEWLQSGKSFGKVYVQIDPRVDVVKLLAFSSSFFSSSSNSERRSRM
jgi:NADPH-dependent curcumin reductase CurA/short-subunit dehydrogenase